MSHAGRIRLVRLLALTGRSTIVIPAKPSRGPLLLDVGSRVGRLERQRFVEPAPAHGQSVSPGRLAATTCDGTSAQVLTPTVSPAPFSRLRVAVGGPGRMTVTLARPGRSPLARRSVRTPTRDVVVSFDTRKLSPGTYDITATPQRSPAPERLVLTALVLQPTPPARPVSGRHG